MSPVLPRSCRQGFLVLGILVLRVQRLQKHMPTDFICTYIHLPQLGTSASTTRGGPGLGSSKYCMEPRVPREYGILEPNLHLWWHLSSGTRCSQAPGSSLLIPSANPHVRCIVRFEGPDEWTQESGRYPLAFGWPRED